ncbi:MAG: hypothetical protein IJA32_00205 [Lachnospiraceae bacterium]|nr:hypothetical protein [Lachnospiraceae bacterium]
MKLYIKQRVVSFLDSYDVYGENFSKKYTVKAELGDIFKLGDHLHIYDLHGREVGVVRQKLLQLMPTYEIEVDGQKLGEIKKQFNLLKKNFDVNYLGLRVDGDFFGWNYSVFQDENLIMTISKEIVSLGDAYMMEFSDPDIEIYGLMLVVAIDAALFKERRNNLWS